MWQRCGDRLIWALYTVYQLGRYLICNAHRQYSSLWELAEGFFFRSIFLSTFHFELKSEIFVEFLLWHRFTLPEFRLYTFLPHNGAFFKKKNYLYTALARWSSAHACKEASCHLSDYGQIQEVLAKKICVSAAWCLPVSGSACPVTFRGVNTIARG